MEVTSWGIKRSAVARWSCAAAVAFVCVAQAATASPAGAWNTRPAGPSGFSYATGEGGRVKNSGVTDIAYGAKGKFNYKYAVTGRISCNNGTFGDPNKGVRKACFVKAVVGPKGFSFVASEYNHLNLSGVNDIAYGDNGKFKYKYAVVGGIDCTNEVFGNPDNGVRKACFVKPVVGPKGFSFVASEYNHLNLSGVNDIAYGDNGKFKYKYAVVGGIDCTNEVFGNPDNGVRKACFVKPVVGPSGFSFVASEYNHLNLSGINDIAYGDAGKFNYKYAVAGGLDCTNEVFGNPDNGVRKACFVKPVVGPAGYTFAVSEYQYFTIVGVADVAYGDNGKFVYKQRVTGRVDCTNEVFGNPDNGVRKACFTKPS